MSMKTAILTGGHLTPALAVAEEMRGRGWRVVYVGRKRALEGDTSPSVEQAVVTQLDFEFISLTTGRIQRRFTRHTLISLVKIPWGLLQSFMIIRRVRPTVLVSFGGYVAVPLVITAWCFGIPIVTHEQTMSPGLANQTLARFCRAVCISWESTRKFFRSQRVVFTGNPIRKALFVSTPGNLISVTKPLILITGGNLGAHAINDAVGEILAELLTKYTLVHQSGDARKFRDFERLNVKKELLPERLRARYHIYKYLNQNEMGWLLKNAEMIVTRAGANITTEIIIFKKPALFIPLSWSGEGEQIKNAEYVATRGGALVLPESQLTSTRLMQGIDTIYKRRMEISQKLEVLAKTVPVNGASLVADVVESVA